MMPCPHCNQPTVSAWRKLWTKYDWSLACPQCGGLLTVSGWSKLVMFVTAVLGGLTAHVLSTSGLRELGIPLLGSILLTAIVIMLRIPFARLEK
jgi:hypothetical protein